MSHQCRDFGVSLDEAEDVVDEQQHVLACVVAEELGHSERRIAGAEAGAGRLIHLAEDQHHGVVEDMASTISR